MKKTHYNSKIYKCIRDNGNWNNWDIIEIEKYSCSDKNEAKKRERYYIELYKPELNTEIPGRTGKEYYEKNIEAIKARRKTIITCECGCKIPKHSLSSHIQSKKHLNF